MVGQLLLTPSGGRPWCQCGAQPRLLHGRGNPVLSGWVMSATLGGLRPDDSEICTPMSRLAGHSGRLSRTHFAHVEGVRAAARPWFVSLARRSRHPCLRTGRMVCRQWRNFPACRRLSYRQVKNDRIHALPHHPRDGIRHLSSPGHWRLCASAQPHTQQPRRR